MRKLYISTTSIKALDCFRPKEESLKYQLIQIEFPNETNCIKQFKETPIYFHFDISNPSDIIIDAENDCLIKHSQSNIDFCSRFKMIMQSIHNFEESSKFRQVYKILLDETITDKYERIYNILKPNIEALNTSNITLFLKDIGDKKITLSQLTQKHPNFTQSQAFKAINNTFYDNDSNVFDCNDSDHLSAFNQLREKLNNSN